MKKKSQNLIIELNEVGDFKTAFQFSKPLLNLCHYIFFSISDLYLQMSISFWSLDRQSQCGSCHVCSQLEHYQRQNLLTRVDLVLCFGSGVFFLPHQYSYSSHFTTLKKTVDSVSRVVTFFFKKNASTCYYDKQVYPINPSSIDCHLRIYYIIYRTRIKWILCYKIQKKNFHI